MHHGVKNRYCLIWDSFNIFIYNVVVSPMFSQTSEVTEYADFSAFIILIQINTVTFTSQHTINTLYEG